MKWKNGYPYRCSKACCRARVTLPRYFEEYIRPPKCRRCGSRSLTLDKYRNRKGSSEGRRTCWCGELPYPHREGSSVWCLHHPVGPSHEDMLLRYGEGYMSSEIGRSL